MASAKPNIRDIVDSFAEDLLTLASEVVESLVDTAVQNWQAKNAKRLAQTSAETKRAAQSRKALERLEKAAERRREREHQRAAERALRLEKRLISGRRPRANTGILGDGPASAPAPRTPTAPPQLFVHKRRRDGEIEPLKRANGNGNGNGANGNGNGNANGNGTDSPAAAPQPVPVEAAL